MAKRITVRQFLALGPNEQPSVMAAEGLWNDIGTLKEEVARLEGKLAAKDAALREWAEDIGCPKCKDGIVGEGYDIERCSHCEGSCIDWPRFYAALSDTGEGWLPSEVREQVRGIQDDFDRWQDEHINANPGNVPACLGRDCPGCKLAREKLRAALAALEVT